MKIKKLTIFSSLFLCSFFVQAQLISGTVLDKQTGKPMAGANVLITETKQGAVTDETGKFQIQAERGKTHTVQISYIGYADTLVNVMSGTQIQIYLNPEATILSEFFVSGNRHSQKKEDIVARVSVIKSEAIEYSPFNNIDEALILIPGIHSDRDQGIFSRNAGVTMRGMNSTARVLVLLNGVPINKADGGGINWNRVNPEQLDRIEVIKGPASSIYGGNAMAGVINIITLKPSSPFSLTTKFFGGTFNTIGNATLMSGNNRKNGKGFYWTSHVYAKQGAGYLSATDSMTTPYDTTNFMKELGLNGTIGYALNETSDIEIEYNFWDDIRGEGIRVFDELGTYSKYTTHFARAKYSGKVRSADLLTMIYGQNENYFRRNESVARRTGKYRFYDTDSYRTDYGGFISVSNNLPGNYHLVYGLEVKSGNVRSDEIYYTSTDITHKQGTMNQYAAFVMADKTFADKKLLLSTGIRFDYAQFRNGDFSIEDPSGLTAFMDSYPVTFTDEDWTAFSPKFGVKYSINNNVSVFASFATGFRPPMLDDMCTNRSITKGFKIANPQLKPEIISSSELGADVLILKKIVIQPSIYYSVGSGFHYFVATGDSVDTGGDAPKPVLIRDNIASVDIRGAEILITYNISKTFNLIANYAYAHSIISEFSNARYEDQNLEGKFLMEVPPHQGNASIQYTNKLFTATMTFVFVDRQWYDDENTTFTEAYNYTNIRITTDIIRNFQLAISCNDIFDQQFVNNKGFLSPGRFFMGSLTYKFAKK